MVEERRGRGVDEEGELLSGEKVGEYRRREGKMLMRKGVVLSGEKGRERRGRDDLMRNGRYCLGRSSVFHVSPKI